MQDRFPPRCHSNRPDSSGDTLKNSSPRSFSVIGNLLNRNDMYIEKSNILFVCSLYRSKREKQCTKPDVFLNVMKCHSSLNTFESKYLKVLAKCLNMTHSKLTTRVLENI